MSQIQPKEGNVFIATYGSLRRNMENFGVNASGNGVFVGKGRTAENYDLYRYMGRAYFPSISLKHSEGNCPVVVDVFEAPEGHDGLKGSYDMLEGYPSFYNRSQIEIVMDSGETLTAWIYHIDEKMGEPIEGGDWCTHKHPSYYENLESGNEETD